jgi:hypothetical protein
MAGFTPSSAYELDPLEDATEADAAG